MFNQHSHLRRAFLARTATLLTVFAILCAECFLPFQLDNSRVTAASPFFAPANDNYANAQPISGATGVITSSNVGATEEPNEPPHAGIGGVGSIWFQWQAPETGNFRLTTFGSFTDTLLAVYTGDSMATAILVPGAFNDEEILPCDLSPARTSGVGFDAIAGTVYHIVVDRKSTTIAGTITLRWGRDASISGRITDASMNDVTKSGAPPSKVQLFMEGGGCYREGQGLFFPSIPTGANYSVFVSSAASPFWAVWPGTPSISPLVRTVSNYNVYKASPTTNINGKVNIPNGDTSGITVTCISTPGGLISYTASDQGLGKYQCAGLPVDTDYIVTAAKLGYNFRCNTINPNCQTSSYRFNDVDSSNIFFADFDGTQASSHTISGLITQPDGTTGMSGVTVSLSGSQTDSKVTNATGNYSFTGVLHGGNYTITPSAANVTFTPTSVSFGNLAGDQSASFIATFQLELILDDKGQVAALDSMALVRDPFPILNSNPLNGGADRNTRVTIFLSNLQLGSTEPPSAVVISLVGSNNQAYDIPAEDVRGVPGLGFTQVMFRLPDTLTAGTCTLVVKAHGLTSNMGAMKISN